MNELTIHRVTKITTELRELESVGKPFFIKDIVITDSKGIRFNIELFGDKREDLNLKTVKKMQNKRCECNETGVLHDGTANMYDKVTELPFVAHEPNECKCTNELKQYIRDGKKLWLCSCCCLSTDKLIP